MSAQRGRRQGLTHRAQKLPGGNQRENPSVPLNSAFVYTAGRARSAGDIRWFCFHFLKSEDCAGVGAKNIHKPRFALAPQFISEQRLLPGKHS